MNRYEIIENLIEKETGRIVNGKAVWDEIETSVGRYEGEDGLAMITGEDNMKERWDYWIELKRETDEYGDTETEIKLLEILILNKSKDKSTHIKIQGATL